MNQIVKIGAMGGGAIVLVLIGTAIGSGAKGNAASPSPTVTVTAPAVTVTAPGPTVTVTAKPPKPKHAGSTMPGNGTFVVGYKAGEWKPGTWQTAGAAGGALYCYWSTLSNLSGNESAIISNDNVSGSTVLQVTSADAGIQVDSCGTWHKIG